MRHGLSDAAQQAIDELRADGVALTDADVVELHAIGRALEAPSGCGPAAGVPIRCGDALWLWPHTIQAAQWYGRAAQWFDPSREESLATLALAYSMAHGRRLGAFDLLQTEPDARRELRAWVKNLTVTLDEVTLSVAAVLDGMAGPGTDPPPIPGADTDADADDPADTDAGALVADLVASCGQTADYWAALVSMRFAVAVLRATATREAAQGGSGSSGPDVHQIIYTRRLAYAAQRIRDRQQADAESVEDNAE